MARVLILFGQGEEELTCSSVAYRRKHVKYSVKTINSCIELTQAWAWIIERMNKIVLLILQ